MFAGNQVYPVSDDLPVHLDFPVQQHVAFLVSKEGVVFVVAFLGLEDAGDDSDEGSEFHVAADRLFQPCPFVSDPVPGQLFTCRVGQNAAEPAAQVLRLNNFSVFEPGNDLLQFAFVLARHDRGFQVHLE